MHIQEENICQSESAKENKAGKEDKEQREGGGRRAILNKMLKEDLEEKGV